MKIPVVVNLRRIPEIFICHSSLDTKLLEEIKTTVDKEKCIPFIAEQKISGLSPCENIMLAISRSDAVFAILTKNSLEIRSTRDWIFFELGFAEGIWRSRERKSFKQYRIYAWKDPDIILPRGSPIEFITTYHPLVKGSRKSRNKMLKEMKEISRDLAGVAYTIKLKR